MRIGKTSKKVRQTEQLILALLQQSSMEKAAASIGISTVTAWRISKTREFRDDYRKARREAFSQSVARLQQASGAAVSTLLKVMVDQTTPPASRVRAADCVLDHAAKAMEIEDIEARVGELERAAESSKSENPA
jgi:hypothetical protein